MDIDKVPPGISQINLAWMREQARDDSSPSDDDSQDAHVSDAEVMFDTITASFEKSSMCPRAVRTPLFPHQKQALHWMMSRENEDHLPPFWEKMHSGHYYNRLLKCTANERPPSIRGGILADDMGLGKTLVIISLVLTNFVDNRPLAVPVPGVHRVRGEKRLQSLHESIAQMDEKDPTKKTLYLPNLRFGKPDSSNIETTAAVTTRLDDMSDVRSTPANRTIYSSSTMQREATVTEFGQPTNAKRKFLATEMDLVYENERSKQRKLYGEKYMSFYENDELPDLEDKELRDEGSDADFMTVNHCDEIGRTLSGRYDPRGTLIICPLSVLSNWQDQFEEHVHTNIHMDIHCYHGSLRSMNSSFIQRKDVVITTYGTVRSDFKRMTSPLFTLNWLRIILDEGHLIRNPLADITKAVLALKAQRKWVVTGTPIQNKMLDLCPLIRFLHATPLKVRSWWEFLSIKQPMIILKWVQQLMDNIAMRREKNDLVDGEPLVNLPKRKVNIERIKMSFKESWRYNVMEELGEIKKMIHVSEAGEKKYMHHETILRLRQMCCHSYLLPQPWKPHYDAEVKKHEMLVNRLKDVSQSEEECAVCVDVLKTPVILPCTHCFCRLCILNTIKYMEQTNQGNATCPMCRVPISEDQVIELPAQPEPHTYGNWNSSTKVDALMSALVKLKSEDPSIKSLVFSGFTSFLTLIETPLREHNFQFVRLDGKMSASQRLKAIRSFSDTKPGSPTIFLISLLVGGMGLNLTVASRVFLMEPQWNPATEEQCFDRCHRLGQTKDVIITKFISADTIEEYILNVQGRKRMMMQQAFKKQPTATERT